HQRVHDAVQVAFPWISGAAQQRAARTSQKSRALEASKRPDDRRGVARDDARAVAIEGAMVTRLGHERMTRDLVLLTAVDHELDPCTAVRFDIVRRYPLGGTVNNDVRSGEQCRERAADLESGAAHRVGLLAGWRIKRVAL